jgi:hypothetical protein
MGIFLVVFFSVIMVAIVKLNGFIEESLPLDKMVYKITNCLKNSVYKNYADDYKDKYFTETVIRPLKKTYLKEIEEVKTELLQIIETQEYPEKYTSKECVEYYSGILSELDKNINSLYSKTKCYYYNERKFENVFYEFLQNINKRK